jgi:hypothetical protein
MTRINCVPPSELHDKHLAAEYYELPRVFSLVRKAIEKGVDPADIPAPENYTLGTGHVKFFYTRLGYCLKRQAQIVAELLRRKKKPDIRRLEKLVAGIPEELFNDWEPDEAAMAINRQRLEERLTEILAKPKRPVPSIHD